MLKVMLADDEPFILQGLEVLIDWEAEGFEIVKLAENGQEALEYLNDHTVDLIFADVKMPVLDGISLLEIIRREQRSDALFVILSGYNEFSYAQRAIRSGCMDYILKPVQKEQLIDILRRAAAQRAHDAHEECWRRKMQEHQIERQLVSVLQGNTGKADAEQITNYLQISGPVRYVHIGMNLVTAEEEYTDEELEEGKNSMLESCRRFLGDRANSCFHDMIGYEREHEIAFIYSQNRDAADRSETEFFRMLQCEIQRNVDFQVYLLVGKKVDCVSQLGHSYAAACMLRSFIGFREKKNVYYYEKEMQTGRSSVVLCKKSLDLLIESIKDNNKAEMNRYLDTLYNELDQTGMDGTIVNMNINYLLFQLIHLAVDQDESVNQEEIMCHISENVFEKQIERGSRSHMRRFISEYAEYLSQLRKNVSGGVLKEIEREIRENYAANLTLKGLSQKYYINSSYLGQIFRKQYGQSFRDYLSSYRIAKAEHLLRHTDKKVAVIAEEVGYHDIDYFINRFISLKGVTPARFRRLEETSS